MVQVTSAGAKQMLKAKHNGNVSAEAVELIREVAQDRGQAVAGLASEYAAHANRKTIKADDVKLAIKNI
jgi:histone H3/H4